jgi:hypothetical protein
MSKGGRGCRRHQRPPGRVDCLAIDSIQPLPPSRTGLLFCLFPFSLSHVVEFSSTTPLKKALRKQGLFFYFGSVKSIIAFLN